MLTISFSYTGAAVQTIEVQETASAAAQTAAIQRALDAVSGHSGGTVSLSSGTFTIVGTGKAADGALKIGSNTTVEGAGLGATVLKLADGSTAVTGIIRTDSGKTLADGTFSTTHDVTIKGLTIDGNKSATTGDVDGFYCGPKPGTAQADTNITLDGVEIMNVSRYGFDPHEQTVGLTIRNSSAHHNGVDGFTIDFASNVLLENNTAYANGRHGFNIVTGSHDVAMIGNTATSNGGSGIVVQTGDNEVREWTHNVSITGGLIDGNGRQGIEVKQSTGISIDHVTFGANAGSEISLQGVDGVALNGNVIAVGAITFPLWASDVRIDGYVQDFGDADASNDRWIGTHNVSIDGITLADPATPSNIPLYDYVVTAGDDIVNGSIGRDVIAAGSGNDIIYGNAGNDLLYGNDGADKLYGGAGNDKLYGGAGSDRLFSDGGIDTVDGGAGSDTIDFSKSTSAVSANLTATTGYEAFVAGTTTALADLISIENAKGSKYADALFGNAAANAIDGYDGNDIINGGSGNDKLTGGKGSDTFVFNAGFGTDTITDFTQVSDHVDFAGISGLTAFSQLAITSSTAGAVVSYAGQSITMTGIAAASLSASDFYFH